MAPKREPTDEELAYLTGESVAKEPTAEELAYLTGEVAPEKKNTIPRMGRAFAEDILRTTGSTVSGLGLGIEIGSKAPMLAAGITPEMAESLSKILQESGRKIEGLAEPIAVTDRSFPEKVAGGFGSMASFMVPGAAAAKLSALPSVAARLVGSGSMTVLESLAEGWSAKEDWLRSHPGDAEGAIKRAEAVVAANIPVLAGTNILADYFGGGGVLKSILKAVPAEATQEGMQQIFGNMAQSTMGSLGGDIRSGKVFEGAGEAALIGGIVGGGASTLAPTIEGPKSPEAMSQAQEREKMAGNAISGPSEPLPSGAPQPTIPQVSPADEQTAWESAVQQTQQATPEAVPQAQVEAPVAPMVDDAPAPAVEFPPIPEGVLPTAEEIDPAEMELMQGLRVVDTTPAQLVDTVQSIAEADGRPIPPASEILKAGKSVIEAAGESVSPEIAQEWAYTEVEPGDIRLDFAEPAPTTQEEALHGLTPEQYRERFPNASLDIYNQSILAAAMAQKAIPEGVVAANQDILAKHDAAIKAKWAQEGAIIGQADTDIDKAIVEASAVQEAPSQYGEQMAPTFYSKMQKDIEARLPERSTPEQVRAILREQKAEEVEWSGVEEFIKGKDRISKSELLDFLRSNQVDIKEIFKGETILSGDEAARLEELYRAERTRSLTEEEHREITRIQEKGEVSSGVPKFSQYQLPGGENYRELLLTLPEKPDQIDISRYEATKDSFGDWQVTLDGRFIGNPVVATSKESAIRKAVESSKKEKPTGFRSSHWDEPNVLAHVRFNERKDADGKRILFIEEIQSDWHQRGRKQGYKAGEAAVPLENIQPLEDVSGFRVWIEGDRGFTDARTKTHEEAISWLKDRLREGYQQSGVPDAPFKKTWHEFALKRMFRYAAENGFDRVAWTTGEQQADRYDLSKQIDDLSVWKKVDGTYDIRATKSGAEIVSEGGLRPEQLEGYVGKDLARAIVGEHGFKRATSYTDKANNIEASATYKGIDLKVGGEGMRGFYDKIIVDAANKIGKRFGAKAFDAKMPWKQGGFVYGEGVGEGKFLVHSIDITPSMRKSAIEEGFALFDPTRAKYEEDRVAFGGKSKESVAEVTQNARAVGKSFGGKYEPSVTPKSLIEKGILNHAGVEVKNARQAAELFAIARDPRIEHFQVLYLKGGKVLSHKVLSSGMPDFVLVTSKMKFDILMTAKRIGADEIYVAHNHPSGDPKASDPDVIATREMSAIVKSVGIKFGGQVITDGDTFTHIAANLTQKQEKYLTAKEQFEYPKEKVTSVQEAIAVASKTAAMGQGHAIMFLDNGGRVISIDQVQAGTKLAQYCDERTRTYRAASFVIASPIALKSEVTSQIFSRRLSDVILYQTPTEGGGITNVESMRYGSGRKDLDEIRNPLSPAQDLLYNAVAGIEPGYYMVAEERATYGATPEGREAFSNVVEKAKVAPGSKVTLRQRVVDTSVEGGSVPAGTEATVIDVDVEGRVILANVAGVPMLLSPQSFKETYRKSIPKAAKPLSTKKQIEKATGLEPSPTREIKDSELLKAWITGQARSARVAAREGARLERAKVTNALRDRYEMMLDAERQRRLSDSQLLKLHADEVQKTRETIAEYVRGHIPPESRGKFTSIILKAKTLKDLGIAMNKVDIEAARIYRRGLLTDIKTLVKRVSQAQNISVDYKSLVGLIADGIEWSGHRQSTLDRIDKTQAWIDAQKVLGMDPAMPQEVLEELRVLSRRPVSEVNEYELERIFEKLQALEHLGRTKFDVRRNLGAMIAERISNECVVDAVPMETRIAKVRDPLKKRGMAEVIGDMLDSGANFGQEIGNAIRPMDESLDLLSKTRGYAGAIYKHFKARIDAAYTRFLNDRDPRTARLHALAQKLKLDETNFKRIGAYAYKMQEGLTEHLLASGMTAQALETLRLTPAETEMYLLMRKEIEAIYPDLQRVSARVLNRQVGKVDNYFPIRLDRKRMADMNLQSRIGEAMDPMGFRKKFAEHGMIEGRKAKAPQPIQLNAMEIAESHIEDVLYFVHMQEHISLLTEVANRDDFKKAVGGMGWKNIAGWLDVLARNGGNSEKRSKADPVISLLRRNYGASRLAFSLTPTLIQLTSYGDSASMIGGGYTAQGVQQFTTSEAWRKFIHETMPEYRNRVGGDFSYTDLSWNRWLEDAQRKGFAALKGLDMVVAGATVIGAYQKYMDMTGGVVDFSNPNPEAIQYAQLMLRRSQSSQYAKDIPLALSTNTLSGSREINRALLQFQSFMLNRWSQIRHDIIRLGLPNDPKKATASMLYIIASVGAETGMRMGSKSVQAALISGLGLAVKEAIDPPDDEYWERFSWNLLQMCPFASPFVASMQYNRDFMPVPIVELGGIVAAPYKIAKARETSSRLKQIAKTIQLLGGLAGVPGSGMVGQWANWMVSEQRLRFPWSEEMLDLKADKKNGSLTPEKARRLAILGASHKAFESRSEAYKRALSAGNLDAAKTHAAEAYKIAQRVEEQK